MLFESSSRFGASTAVEVQSSQRCKTIVFIDAGVEDWQSLQAGVLPNVEAHVLEPDADAIAKITAVLQNRNDVEAVHLFAHGAPGCIYLSNSELSLNTLSHYENSIQQWFSACPTMPTLSLYSCNVAAGDAGEEFTHKLHQLTGAQIYATPQVVGNPCQGGTWILAKQSHLDLPSHAPVFTLQEQSIRKFSGSLAAPTDILLGERPSTFWNGFTETTRNSQKNEPSNLFFALKDDGSTVTWGWPYFDILSEPSLWGFDLAGFRDITFTTYGVALIDSEGNAFAINDVYGGFNTRSYFEGNFRKLYSTYNSFAALDSNGSIVLWDDFGAFQRLDDLVGGTSQVFANAGAFAILKEDGSVVTWEPSKYDFFGGDSKEVDFSGGVRTIVPSNIGFAAIKKDGSVVTWGNDSPPNEELDFSGGVHKIFSNGSAFAALKNDGSVVTWGDEGQGGDSSQVDFSGGVREIFSTLGAFAAVKNDDSVVTWGSSFLGGSAPFSIPEIPSPKVRTLVSSAQSFVAITIYGELYAWGNPLALGSIPLQVLNANNLLDIQTTYGAFAALTEDGAVFTWGSAAHGGDSSDVDLSSGVRKIYSNGNAFAALKDDGSVVTWGNPSIVEASSHVSEQLASGIVSIPSSLDHSFVNITHFNENLAPDSFIGRFRTTDPDSRDTFTYSFASGEGDDDNAAFSITSDRLHINRSPDYETQNEYRIRVRTTDKSGGFYEEAITLTVNDITRETSSFFLDKSTGQLSAFGITSSLGFFSAELPRTVADANWSLRAIGDLNGDAQADLVLQHSLSGQVTAFYMNAGNSQLVAEGAVGRQISGPNWEVAGTGDFNGDGKTDLLLRNNIADQTIAWYMNDQGKILSETLVGRRFEDSRWKIETTADFTGDGQADWLLRHYVSGQNLLMEMDGTEIVSERLIGRVVEDLDWQIVGTKDLNGDGEMDIIWQNSIASQTLAWQMQDGQIAQERLIAGISARNTELVF